MNFHWPSTSSNALVPWYKIVRRLTFWPLLLVGLTISYIAIALMFGLSGAEKFRRDQMS